MMNSVRGLMAVAATAFFMTASRADGATLRSTVPIPIKRPVPSGTSVVVIRVGVLVSTTGAVDSVWVLDNIPGLDLPALAAARNWRFRPSTDESGRPVRTRVVIPFRAKVRFMPITRI